MAWSLKNDRGSQWPDGDDGEPIPPVFLMQIHGGPLDTELTFNLLEAYGIPYVCEYPNNGSFGKLILGFPSSGIEVYVPETLLEDAQNILNADFYDDDSGEGTDEDIAIELENNNDSDDED